MPITHIDRAAAKKISVATQKALEDVAEELGLTVTVNGGRFDPNVGTYVPKVEFALDGAEEKEFARNSLSFRWLSAADYGAVIEVGGEQLELTAIRTRAPRFPFIGKVVGGTKQYKLPEHAVRAALGR